MKDSATPSATYRLQMRGGMTFARAARLASYLARLGVSHLYLSPIFAATPGSTHGYDGIDCNRIEPELGGDDGFIALAEAMQASGVGIILDIVPNHMAASPLNPWWRDALEWGAASAYAGHFDVDWSAPKLIVPRLGDHYGAVLKAGGLKVCLDAAAGELQISYGDLRLPLNPPSYARLLGTTSEDRLGALALRFASSSPAGVGELKAELAALLADPELAMALHHAAACLDHRAVHALHEQQVWRLAHWRTARENLTYRRFFEISELVGVRVEQPNVFDDVHRTVLALVGTGHVQGLRIDHIDGLADPLGYLQRLRNAVGRDDVYIIVEKILAPDETLRRSWPVAGTTGYEFIGDLSRLLVDEGGRAPLEDGYIGFVRESRDFEAAILDLKRRTLTRNLAGELDYLTHLASAIASGDLDTRDIGADTLRRAIVELAAGVPVYRTYVDASGVSAEDLEVFEAAVAAARLSREVEDEAALAFLQQLLALDVGSPERRAQALLFATRFQQTSGPLTAKAVEDTLFYRYNRLIALNEVGGDPGSMGGSVDDFHAAMARRLRAAPLSLSATATHDTKRGEDARARLYALSEAPEAWTAAVGRWSCLNAAHRGTTPGNEVVPDADTEWMFYQALLGAWPGDRQGVDAAELEDFCRRMAAYMRKAVREAKLRTTWTQPDAIYEAALEAFIAGALGSAEFLADFTATAQPYLRAGAVNSLTQLCLKIFAPGVPDIYQGTELWDLALVDPDNRRPVDFAARSAMLEKADESLRGAVWMTGALKLHILQSALRLRGAMGPDFATAGYMPLVVEGPMRRHVIAFARAGNDRTLVIIAVRLPLALIDEEFRVPPSRWQDTRVRLPDDGRWTEALTQRALAAPGNWLEIREALRDLPVAVLRSNTEGL